MDSLYAKAAGGSFVDLTELSWLYPALPTKRKLFCYYVASARLYGDRSATECARLAGYKGNRVNITADQLLNKTDIALEVDNLKEQLADRLTKTYLKDEIFRIVQSKVARAEVNVLDYYEGGLPKPQEDLTDQQQRLIVDVEYKNGMMKYRLDKAEAERDLVDMWQHYQEAEATEDTGYDVEATMRSLDGAEAMVKVSHKPFEYQHATNPSYED